jgi:hypothetical protein
VSSYFDAVFIEAARTSDQLKNKTSCSMNGRSGRNKTGARCCPCHRAAERYGKADNDAGISVVRDWPSLMALEQWRIRSGSAD